MTDNWTAETTTAIHVEVTYFGPNESDKVTFVYNFAATDRLNKAGREALERELELLQGEIDNVTNTIQVGNDD